MIRDATRANLDTRLPSGVPPTLAGIIEYTQATALYYWHPAEAMFGHGPGCAIGQWLWDFAERLEADGLPKAKTGRPARVPSQRLASVARRHQTKECA